MLTLTEQPKPLTKVAWCPTRTGLLATLTRDSNIIRLYDMQHAPSPIGDETEPTIIERSVQPCDSQIGSFAWHPSTQNRMVVVSAANRAMTDFTVFERISLAWSSTTALMWACGRHLYECAEDGAEGLKGTIEADIATKMRQRAQSRYGHDTVQVWRNHLLAGGNDPMLKSLWYDLSYMKQCAEDLQGNKQSVVYSGIKNIVKTSSGTSESRRCWSGSERQADVPRFHSEERGLALRLCGWTGPRGSDQDVEPLLRTLEQEQEWERAAAVALFNMDIRRAIQILNKGATAEKGDLNLNVVAMALSGYTDEKASLWREMCSSLRLQLNNPYLCVMFAFLTSESGAYDAVLNESSVAVRDRVAFACMFLNDTQLPRYVDKLSAEMKDSGNLEGVLLTGLLSLIHI